MGIKQEPGTYGDSATDNASLATDHSGQHDLMDPIDSLLDLTEYDAADQFNMSALTSTTTKSEHSFARATSASTPSSMLSAGQRMTRPSHQYDQYKQQTGFVPGALANTFAVTPNVNTQMAGYTNLEMPLFNVNGSDEVFDFNSAPDGTSVSPSDIGLEFESPAADLSFIFADQQLSSVSPRVIVPSQMTQSAQSTPVNNANGIAQQGQQNQQSTDGRLWPGMHQQAAMAKAQAQQRRHQSVASQSQSQSQTKDDQHAQPQPQRAKIGQASDPIVEQKITQLLSSMRARPTSPSDVSNGIGSLHRVKKDEEDMDEDERLLASEEGKKLTSKERRQLRNKVSARAFRSRRKEYISQLESEIAGKVNENSDLRAQNRLLIEENRRLSDLTRLLLGSPSFSDFLDRLSSNPALLPQSQPSSQVQASSSRVQAPVQDLHQGQERQSSKDPNPFPTQHQIGMAMIPEQNIDFSTLHMEFEPTFTFQPQVYAVLNTPEVTIPTIETSIFTGKESNFVACTGDDEKSMMPTIERLIASKAVTTEAAASVVTDAEFENDPSYSLYHSDAETASTPSSEAEAENSLPSNDLATLKAKTLANGHVFAGIEKAPSQYKLVGASESVAGEMYESIAIARISRIASSIEKIAARLDLLNAE
ncbi:hypothetical protein SEPCBS119000_000885 [Sporothrix epigloea]|uniref:BZIP domain-containing protein n=1 Tax=Sporothrix epigloea TaxID=1892477 RepID=A0ABP0DAL3_9PEZI